MRSLLTPIVARSNRGASLLLIGVVLLLTAPGAALGAGFTARLVAPNHSPTANEPWPITVYVTRGRAKLSGSVNYHFLYNGAVVSRQPGYSFRNGVYHDHLKFPSDAIGYQLTLQVIVHTKYGTDYIDWAVKTRA